MLASECDLDEEEVGEILRLLGKGYSVVCSMDFLLEHIIYKEIKIRRMLQKQGMIQIAKPVKLLKGGIHEPANLGV